MRITDHVYKCTASLFQHNLGSRDGGFDSRTRRHMWVEFIVGSRPCSERFFSGHSGFPLSSETNSSKFQFDLDYCQALYHEPLARDIAQALPVLLTLIKLHYLAISADLIVSLDCLCLFTLLIFMG